MNIKYFINKLALTILAILAITHIHAQDKNGIYVVVKGQKKLNISKRTENVVRSTYISEDYKEPAQIFNLYISSMDVCLWRLWHFYRITPNPHENNINPLDQHKTFLKDSLFLNTVDCLYWDDVKDLSWGEAKEYIGKLLYQIMPDGSRVKRIIYVVDLAEKQLEEKIKIYQVENMSGREWSRTIFIDENDKQEWIKHSKIVKEKIDKRRAERKARPFKK